jgi:hypothetical protein
METTEAILLLLLGLLVGAAGMFALRTPAQKAAQTPAENIQIIQPQAVEESPSPYWWWYGLPNRYPTYISPYWFYDVPYYGPITGSEYYPSPKPWYGGRGMYAPHGPRPGYSGVSVGGGGGGGGGGGHGGGR